MKEDKDKKNQGSAIIEVTLIMPMLLMILVILLTLLLGGLKQAKIHTELMWYSIASEQRINDPDIEVSARDDKVIYARSAELLLVRGYELTSKEQQVVRASNVEENVRRWQLLGYIASEGRLSSVFDVSDEP